MKKYQNWSIAPESNPIIWLNNIEKPGLLTRAVNLVMGIPAVANQLNKTAILEFIADGQIVKNDRTMGNMLKFTPRVIKNATQNDMHRAKTYVCDLINKLGFEEYVLMRDDESAVYVSLCLGKNIAALKNVGHLLNFQPNKSITQEMINKIHRNNITR